MTTNNSVNVGLSGSTGTGSFVGSASPTLTGTLTYPSPWTLGATSVTSTGTQLNLLNALTVVPINKVVKQVFTSSGTYTPTTGMVYCIIECVGSGGGGGGCVNSIAGQGLGGGGGGAGSYSRLYAVAATIGGSQTVTVGNGGTAGANTGGTGGAGNDVSVGSLCIGKGGSGGAGIGTLPTGGAGGVAGTGDFTSVGQGGTAGCVVVTTSAYAICGQGAASVFGGSPAQVVASASTATNGATGANYGAGANGGLTVAAGGAVTGGVGAKGVVIITEFLSA